MHQEKAFFKNYGTIVTALSMTIKITIMFVYHGRNYITLDIRDFRMKTSIRPLDMLKYLDTRHFEKIFYHHIENY